MSFGISMCLSIYQFTIRKWFFSNERRWIFVILGYSDHQVGEGDNRGVQEFGVNGHLGHTWGHCSNMLKVARLAKSMI